MRQIGLFITSAVLTGSFALAVVDQDFRHNFVRVAITGMNTVAVLAKDTNKSRSKDKSQPDG